MEFRNPLITSRRKQEAGVFRRLHPFDVFQNLVPVQSVFVFLV